MDVIRAEELKVGKLYRWNLGDPEEIFLVLEVPRFIDPVCNNHLRVVSNKFSSRTMHIFASDKFFEVT